MATKLWDKGFEPDKMIEEYTVGNDRELDMRLARYDVQGSLAHIAMLETIGLLTAGAQRRPSARTGGRRHGARKLRIAHHVGHGADALPVAQDGAGAILALAYGRRIRVAAGDRRGHRNLRKIHNTTG